MSDIKVENKAIPWLFYIIENKGSTYAGVSPYPDRRLRQHNGEIKGGAKYTISKGPGWRHICLIKGFRTKIEAMQFEWAVKHAPPRNAGGLENRIKKLFETCNKDRWTSNAPLAENVHLEIQWKNQTDMLTVNVTPALPKYITMSNHHM